MHSYYLTLFSLGDGYWGSWGYSGCPPGSFVVGLRTMVEPPQYQEDDTALNRAEFRCGRYPTTYPASPSYGCRCGDNVNKYSWEVELVQDPSTTQEPYCRGTLISENEIVTAAHCGATSWVRLQTDNVPAKVELVDKNYGQNLSGHKYGPVPQASSLYQYHKK